ncbi:MAG: LysR family transcriptional regulator [Bdellovibrionota bacterium]
METLRLKQFKTIVEAGGLLKASELLGISGGGLSKSMAVLEREVGYKLFLPKGRGLELTEGGKRFYERIPETLKAIEFLLDKIEPSKNVLKLTSFEVFTTYFLSDVIATYLGQRNVEIREAIPGQMESLIAEGYSDVGITYLPIPKAGIEFLKAGKIRMGIFGLNGLWKKTATKDLPFIVPISPLEGIPSGMQGLDGWPEHLFERFTQYRVEMMETAIQLSQRGLGVSFLPEFIINKVNERSLSNLYLEEIAPPPNIKSVYRDVFLIHRRGFEETKTMRDLAKAIRKLS